MNKILITIPFILFALIIIFAQKFKSSETKSLVNKYKNEIQKRSVQQVMNKISQKHLKIAYKKNDHEFESLMISKINNEILYKDNVPLKSYFNETTEELDLFYNLYAKFTLKDNKDYYKYKSILIKKMQRNPLPYKTAFKNIIERLPVNQFINEKRDIYEFATVWLEQPDESLKNNIISDITKIPSIEPDDPEGHTPGLTANSAEAEALYQSIRLYKKLFNDKESTRLIKTLIKTTQNNQIVTNRMLSLINNIN